MALRDVVTNAFANPLSIFKKKKREEFWALKGVDFSIKQGEVVGIIGKNGAGKSTLLKILSQITPPTKGEIKINGRIGSLLEVGTGFHPELTGRENIFLNGAILGMKKKEIAQKFNQIVEFAGIDKFLDTPVKYYSSGMYVRLAFSVAAHMETDILIIDEVLAVGDAEFQKKCLGKMDEITKKEGRTILFVSHNMSAIERLCKKIIVLEKGEVGFYGQVKEGIFYYLNNRNKIVSGNELTWDEANTSLKNDWFLPKRFAITDMEGNAISSEITRTTKAFVSIEGILSKNDPAITIGYALYDENNQAIYWSYHTDDSSNALKMTQGGVVKLFSELPTQLLNEGSYRIELIGGIHNKQWFFEPEKNAPELFITISGVLSNSPYWTTKRPGIIAPTLLWKKR